MKLFVHTPICRSRAHCITCRDPGGDGPAWRKTLAKRFVMPDECPHGAGVGEGWKLQGVPTQQPPAGQATGGCCGG